MHEIVVSSESTFHGGRRREVHVCERGNETEMEREEDVYAHSHGICLSVVRTFTSDVGVWCTGRFDKNRFGSEWFFGPLCVSYFWNVFVRLFSTIKTSVVRNPTDRRIQFQRFWFNEITFCINYNRHTSRALVKERSLSFWFSSPLLYLFIFYDNIQLFLLT